MDAHAAILEAFEEELFRHVEVIRELDSDDLGVATELGREAAGAVIGPLYLRRLLGDDRLETADVSRLLGVTRQALHKRVHGHTILAIPGRGTTWYPAWQFDAQRRQLRPQASAIVKEWARILQDDYDPEVLLAWAVRPQAELDDLAPCDWILEDKDEDRLLTAGRHVARRLAA